MEGVFALFSLAGRVAVVTGAASGLGRAIAAGFAGAGAFVVAVDLPGAGLDDAVEEIGGRAVRAVTADVTSRDDVEAVVDEALRAVSGGRIDVLVNSAGIGARGAAAEYESSLWERVLAVNLTGTFNCCQAVGRHMLEAGGGSIVNIASIGGLVGYAGSVGYQASKGGVVQLTKTLAVEWAERGVRVNAIAPCTFETPVVARQRAAEPDLYPGMLARIPIGRFGEPDEIVGPALFLATDAASMVTGHILTVDGGYTAQ
jgi:NAD(P)-dependent dehydrogenase (short-subunit alcohol dehydrogenase family)